MANIHPTKEALIRSALTLLAQQGEGGFTVDDVLKHSGISKGSMYHHFDDFDDLLDHAHVRRFAEYVDEDIAAFAAAMKDCRTVEAFLERIEGLARSIHGNDRRERRAQRVATLGRAFGHKKMLDSLSVEEERMTEAFADLMRELQERNILQRNFSPKMYSSFVQAYSLGKILDDISEHPLDPEDWTMFVVNVLKSFAVGPGEA